MKIVIFGLGKIGTTALYYKILNPLPLGTRVLFELTEYVNKPRDGEVPVLAKVLIDSFLNNNISSFKDFDKKILIIRYPRDKLISVLLYFIFNKPFISNYEFLIHYVKLVECKEKDPKSISILELLKMRDNWKSIELSIKEEDPLGKLSNLYGENEDLFILRYEDFVDGKLDELEEYLGFKLEGNSEVLEEHKSVERTKSKGDWKN